MFRFELQKFLPKQRTQLDGATQFFFWWNFFAGKIMEIGRQPPVPNPSSFYFSGVWGPRNPSLKKWENLPINYPPLPLGRPLEIPENGTLFRVPMSTVEYQIGHDQKLILLPLEPQQV